MKLLDLFKNIFNKKPKEKLKEVLQQMIKETTFTPTEFEKDV